ncbi:MAG: efflux RND transporter periplasmic adaptor subunit [Pirellulaceae bacterium]
MRVEIATIASYISGRVERLFADYTGVEVQTGDHLAVVYSPELYSKQVEYIETRRGLANLTESTLPTIRTSQEKLVEGSRKQLMELGLTDDQIAVLEQTERPESRLTVYAPSGGTVIEKLVAEGDYLAAGEPIYRVVDLSLVWLKLEVFPDDAAKIRFGQMVAARLDSLPGETFWGRVAFVGPTVDPRTRTVSIRVEFANDERQLRPGDYATASIRIPVGELGEVYDAELAGKWISPMHPQVLRDEPGLCPICGMPLVPTSRYGYADQPVDPPTALVIPRSAVLMAGDSSVVYVEVEPGRFAIRPITLGAILNDSVVVLKGLEPGDQVATAGNFLIDSQMQLAGNPSLIDPSRAIAKLGERKTPLEIAIGDIQSLPGEAGVALEQLIAGYLGLQTKLAADELPSSEEISAFRGPLARLREQPDLPEELRNLVAEMSAAEESLLDGDIETIRLEAFRPISHAMLETVSLARGDGASQSLFQMFCPMVKGGGGDWIQANDQLVNPYWGSRMLRCGDVIQELPTRPTNDPSSSTDATENGDASDGGSEGGE